MDRRVFTQNMKKINIELVASYMKFIDLTDIYTKNHSFQVAEIAFIFGKTLGFSEKELTLIKFAGLLHDIGKITIPEEIYNKPGSLNEYEWKIMKEHPKNGAEMIKTIDGLKEIEKWILYHHEKYDGTGYPDGLRENEIPYYARIIAICDSYSAMVSDRPYKKSRSASAARAEIKECKGKQFDPEIVDAFLTLRDEDLERVVEE